MYEYEHLKNTPVKIRMMGCIGEIQQQQCKGIKEREIWRTASNPEYCNNAVSIKVLVRN